MLKRTFKQIFDDSLYVSLYVKCFDVKKEIYESLYVSTYYSHVVRLFIVLCIICLFHFSLFIILDVR